MRSVRWADFASMVGRQWRGANPAANKLGEILSIDQIKKLVPNPGDRGIVGGLRAGRDGHYFNVVNQNGVIRFLDGQTGTVVNLKDGFMGFLFMFTR
jgi:filamentous hemagglutinin